ncbi:ankyrin repeat domain-containing protein [Rhizobacter sp. P5_C2]
MDTRLRNRGLVDAVEGGDIERFAALIGGDESLLHMATPYGTWLHVAAAAGRLNMVKYLVRQGFDPNARGGVFGGGPINVAAAYGHVEVVEYLLAEGAQMDVSEPERNPLFSAIYGGHNNVVLLLLKKGIDASVKYSGDSMSDMDALAFARERGRTDIAEILARLI